MKILTVCVLGFVMMVLVRATVRRQLVKRSTYCRDGWSEISGRCFQYIPKAMTWATAETNCQSLGANLASVHNLQEHHRIQHLILTVSHEHPQTWIGGSDAQQENVWIWSDGKPFHYTNWCKGEPNDRDGKQNCIQMNYGGEKCWDDLRCDTLRPSVCAKKCDNCGTKICHKR